MGIVGFSKLLVDQQTGAQVKPISGDSTWIIAELGCVDAALGKRTKAEKIIQEMKKRTAHEYIDPVLQGSAFHRIPGEAGATIPTAEGVGKYSNPSEQVIALRWRR
jgi:hypothetical protein